MNQEVKKIQELAAVIGNNDLKQYPVQGLLARFASFEEQFRYDQVVRNVQQVLEKKAFDNPQTVVSAEELSQIANQFATLGSTDNFKTVVGDLLPETVVEKDKKDDQFLDANRHLYTDEGTRSPETEAAIEVDEDESLQLEVPNAYAKVFDKQDSKYGYLKNPELVGRGQYLVEDELRGLGHTAKVEYSTCNTDTLLYVAAVDTDFGKQRIFIPVEMVDSQVLYPTSFATNSKIYELSKQGLNHFLADKKADYFGKHMKVADGVRDNMFTDTVREMKQQDGFEVDENTHLDEKAVMPDELIPVEKVLEDAMFQKESAYSKEQIFTAVRAVREELTRCGYQSQLRFIGDNKDGVNVSATVQTPEGNLSIKVPVEVTKEGGVLFPAKFVSAAPVEEDVQVEAPEYKLSKEGLAEYIANNQESVLPVRYSGEMVGLNFNALRRAIFQSVRQQRYAVAEQALNVIADKYGEDSHAAAMEDYKEWLLNKTLDFKDNFGLGMRASTDGIKEPGWDGEIVTNQIKLT